jgi:hypothetical protein
MTALRPADRKRGVREEGVPRKLCVVALETPCCDLRIGAAVRFEGRRKPASAMRRDNPGAGRSLKLKV